MSGFIDRQICWTVLLGVVATTTGCPLPEPAPSIVLYLNYDAVTLTALGDNTQPSDEDSATNAVDFNMLFPGYGCVTDAPPPCCIAGSSVPVAAYALTQNDQNGDYYHRSVDVAESAITCSVQTLVQPFNVSVTNTRPTGVYTMGIFGASGFNACAVQPTSDGVGEAGWAWGPPLSLSSQPIFFAFGPDEPAAFLPTIAAHEFGHTLNLAHVEDGYNDIMQPDLMVGTTWGDTSVPLADSTGTQNDTAIIDKVASGQRRENTNLDCTRLAGAEEIDGFPNGTNWIMGQNNPNFAPGNGIPTTGPDYRTFTYFENILLPNPALYKKVVSALQTKSSQGYSLGLGANPPVYPLSHFGPIFWELHTSVDFRSTTLEEEQPPPTQVDTTPDMQEVSVATLTSMYLDGQQFLDSSGNLGLLPNGFPGVGTLNLANGTIDNVMFAHPSLAQMLNANGAVVISQSTPSDILTNMKPYDGTLIWFTAVSTAENSAIVSIWAFGPAE
jgi:hypothetical protein